MAAHPVWSARTLDVTRDIDIGTPDLHTLLDLTASVKHAPSRYSKTLAGRYLALLFEKPSLRTRLTFELAIKQLGGDAVTITGPIGEREPLKDVARNLDRWTQAIAARTFLQDTIDELAQWSNVPVINALSDMYHPCQALADMFTLKEQFGELRGRTLAFVGDGNNVAHSLMLNAARLGVHFTLAAPADYQPNPGVVAEARRFAAESGSSISISADPFAAVRSADAIYTDVWASMGQEREAAERARTFAAFQVNERLLESAPDTAIFLHCLPAKRGQEVSDGVMEHAQSRVFDQAENRLHAQKALLLMLLG